MARNTLGDLNDHLFMQLERLGDEEQSIEELEMEMDRANAIAKISAQIVNNANLVLKAKIKAEESIGQNPELPRMLEG